MKMNLMKIVGVLGIVASSSAYAESVMKAYVVLLPPGSVSTLSTVSALVQRHTVRLAKANNARCDVITTIFTAVSKQDLGKFAHIPLSTIEKSSGGIGVNAEIFFEQDNDQDACIKYADRIMHERALKNKLSVFDYESNYVPLPSVTGVN